GRSAIWRVLAVAAAIVVVAAAGFGAWWLIAGADGSATAPPPAPPVFVPSSPETTATDSAVSQADTTVGPAGATATGGDSVGRAAPSPRLARDTAAAAAAQRPAPAQEPAVPLVVRWTDNWVNLREGPGTGYGIVRVIQPGVRLEVSAPSRGWWPVWEVGEIVGYVAGSELTGTPPDSTR
ncbi:MAG: SH3 domain-containing protein, partial [Armatimonadota bacterium]